MSRCLDKRNRLCRSAQHGNPSQIRTELERGSPIEATWQDPELSLNFSDGGYERLPCVLWDGPPLPPAPSYGAGVVETRELTDDHRDPWERLGKNLNSVVGLDAEGQVVLRRRVRRSTFAELADKLHGGVLRGTSSRPSLCREGA